MTRQIGFGLAAVTLILATMVAALLAIAAQPAGAVEAPATIQSSRIVAYYFHGNLRCTTCRKLEAYSQEAITTGFAKEMESGALEWRVVNVDEPENKHFVADFELVTKSLVLVEYRDSEVARYSNLKLVWQLVGDKDGFLKYVRDSTREFISQR